jgi:hypothetical protein
VAKHKTKYMTKAKVSLGLARLSVPEKIKKSRKFVKSISADARFVNPLPPLAEVTTATDELETTSIAAQGGGPAQTALMHDSEDVLDSKLTQLGNYVEIIANGDETIILAAGMDVKGKGARQPNKFVVVNGEHEGEAMLQTPVTPRASYVWQMSPDPLPSDTPSANGTRWEQFAITTISTVTINDLKPGTKYWFRVAPITSAGQGLWSDPISIIAQ